MNNLPESASAELSRLLADWAVAQRISAAQADEIHAKIIASAPDERALDVDWLWNLMRPVTSLLDVAESSGRALRRWPFRGDDDRLLTPYLQLA